MPAPNYDALLLLSFGGPNQPEDVIPFLENVTRGRGIPPERLEEVAQHYYHFGGASPINEQNLALIAALKEEFARAGLKLPIYWGNRNWRPLLPDALGQMAADGVERALVFVTSVFSSYSGCRQYREDIERALAQLGPQAPPCDKLRTFYNHPGYIDAVVARVEEAAAQIPAERRAAARLLFTAHSIPMAMAQTCDYEQQLLESCRLVSERLGGASWQLVYQSRSGPPQVPWLEPDVCDVIRETAARQTAQDIVAVPIGFISDHMEVIFDLDEEAAAAAREAGLNFVRAKTVGTHPRFVEMIRQLVEERLTDAPQRLSVGQFGPSPDVCPPDCCRYEPRRPIPNR